MYKAKEKYRNSLFYFSLWFLCPYLRLNYFHAHFFFIYLCDLFIQITYVSNLFIYVSGSFTYNFQTFISACT